MGRWARLFLCLEDDQSVARIPKKEFRDCWTFLVSPVLIGSIIIVCIALLYNNVFKNRQYPKFWL
ncbi:HPP family protein [Paenibacillus sp. DRB1-1]|uniref:HPP family protein n=1 Tax=Paenibacillus sp. DRB1-1 TaxID=3422309 RepID=UPI003F95FC46